MGPGRALLLLSIALGILVHAPAEAGWWFSEENRQEKSGLDLDQGYDKNTVATLEGKILSVDAEGGSGPVLAVMQGKSETTTLVLGPKEFWRSSGFSLHNGDEVTVKGSKAMGQDGRSYLIVQSVTNSSARSEITLRNEAGRPSWSGNNQPSVHHQPPMRQHRGGRSHR